MPRDREQDTRDAFGDAVYDAWRAGRNSDAVDYERVRDDIYEGWDRYAAAEREVERLRPRRTPEEA